MKNGDASLSLEATLQQRFNFKSKPGPHIRRLQFKNSISWTEAAHSALDPSTALDQQDLASKEVAVSDSFQLRQLVLISCNSIPSCTPGT